MGMDLPALFRTQGFSAAVPQAGGRISKRGCFPTVLSVRDV